MSVIIVLLIVGFLLMLPVPEASKGAPRGR
jgi:competence protein ComGC